MIYVERIELNQTDLLNLIGVNEVFELITLIKLNESKLMSLVTLTTWLIIQSINEASTHAWVVGLCWATVLGNSGRPEILVAGKVKHGSVNTRAFTTHLDRERSQR